jgi:hypothetical protein
MVELLCIENGEFVNEVDAVARINVQFNKAARRQLVNLVA